MSHARILIIEDDGDIRSLVRTLLEREAMDVVEAADGSEGLRTFYGSKPDLVVLDIGIPEVDGWDVLSRIRELSDVPVLILTAGAGELEKVRGLREGADDYVTKPFGRQELIARVHALLRRSREDVGDAPEVHADELLEIDFPQRRVSANGRDVELTPTEFKLIGAFARNPNQVLTHDQLLELVWGDSTATERDQVKLYVGYLRRKLRQAAEVDPIETVRGFGYRYRPTARNDA